MWHAMRKYTHNIKACFVLFIVYCLLLLTLGSCSSNKYQRTYRIAWKQVVNSPEWQASLASNTKAEQKFQQASLSGMDNNNLEALPMDKAFIERYHRLVSRAYFKIIAEAEKSDSQIKESYEQLLAKEGPPEEVALAKRRYRAHTSMLEGLKSWNAFSEDATADIEFFKAEHVVKAHEMLQKGQAEEDVVRYLMLEMADLYHVEEMGIIQH